MPWYSEKLTPMGRWSPQITADRPRERSGEGGRFTLRRVRELAPDESHLDLGALKARADAAEQAAWDAAQGDIEDDGFVTVVGIGARDPVVTGLE